MKEDYEPQELDEDTTNYDEDLYDEERIRYLNYEFDQPVDEESTDETTEDTEEVTA